MLIERRKFHKDGTFRVPLRNGHTWELLRHSYPLPKEDICRQILQRAWDIFGREPTGCKKHVFIQNTVLRAASHYFHTEKCFNDYARLFDKQIG